MGISCPPCTELPQVPEHALHSQAVVFGWKNLRLEASYSCYKPQLKLHLLCEVPKTYLSQNFTSPTSLCCVLLALSVNLHLGV